MHVAFSCATARYIYTAAPQYVGPDVSQTTMHAYVPVYILTVFPNHNPACAFSFTHACMHMHRSHVILTSSHIHYSDEPNAIFSFRCLRSLIERRYSLRAALPPLTKSDRRCEKVKHRSMRRSSMLEPLLI